MRAPMLTDTVIDAVADQIDLDPITVREITETAAQLRIDSVGRQVLA